MTGTIAVFGETLWDLLPDGAVLGGAPCNFAYRVHSLGGQAALISRLGSDSLGNQAMGQIEALGLDSRYIQRDSAMPTGTVKIEFDANHQPCYEIVRHVAYDYIESYDGLIDLARSCRALCFGTLAQRNEISRHTLRSLISALDRKHGAIAFLDVNLRKDCYTPETVIHSLEQADVIKLNEDEAHALAAMLGISASDLPVIADALIKRYQLRHCLITLGERGALCVSADGQIAYEAGYEVTVIDPCGSGDAFSSGFIMSYLRGQDIESCCHWGNILGAIVASQRGATAPISEKMITEFRQNARRRISDARFSCSAIQ